MSPVYRSWRRLSFGFVALFLLTACNTTQQDVPTALDSAAKEAVEDGVQGIVFAVDAPSIGLSHISAGGLAHGDGAQMTPDTAFYSASVGKLFVAAAVYALAKEGKIDLGAPFVRYVDFAATGISGLPVVGGDEALRRITVRQLLSHQSGLPDYFGGESKDGSPNIAHIMSFDPGRVFTRPELFAYTRDHFAPVGGPGDVVFYADVNFDLLGLVLEGASQQASYAAVVREGVLAPLGLKNTWTHATEPQPPNLVVADVFLGSRNMRGTAALSADQAGGGMVTTVGDLILFMRSLLRSEHVSIEDFGTDFAADAVHDGIDLGAPLWRVRPGGIFFALGGLPTLVGHSGSTGVWLYYAEDIDTVFAGAASTDAWAEEHIAFLLRHVVPVVSSAVEQANSAR